MNKMAPQEFGYANLFMTEEAQYPHILPHHLFLLVAANASKEYVCLFVEMFLLMLFTLFTTFRFFCLISLLSHVLGLGSSFLHEISMVYNFIW